MERREEKKGGVRVEEEEEEEEEDGDGEEETEGEEKRRVVVGGLGKKARQGPCCQAERCRADLSAAKRYHRRHKVCEVHSKSPSTLVAGLLQRFCQQCSRFHELSEFDEAKRSCRRRLAGHNERRRKTPSTEGGVNGRRGGAVAIAIDHNHQLKDNSNICRHNTTDQVATAAAATRMQINPLQPNPTSSYKHFQIR
ncbi:hypothetical protein AMTRI_Chr02g215190 [Amborella trichopoda]|uniref:SBP-type domain-containing protein n=1 Tax=Amborella trichopoda TaxID=13333 RepID=U5DBY8_AMBTC|nr:squamosa promoter-binding-like protein 3 [Amborella trichopoda]ERN19735.1 hypothetical protein AMTR_s00062p00211520 [Amborella trichopoda]|eukprot:XP_006858268.1 squamosa promoter-binding-like protein 3 [Amborella trichopoda]